jgi:tetratricopeptide (TPR) repeat protein
LNELRLFQSNHPTYQCATRFWRNVQRLSQQCYQTLGDETKAEPLLEEALIIRQKVLGTEHPDTVMDLENLADCEFDLGRIEQATALARQASAARLTTLSKVLSFTSEQQRLAYLDVLYPYSLFPFLKGTEADLAVAILRYKGVVLDSIVEDRLLAQASQGTEGQKLPGEKPMGGALRGRGAVVQRRAPLDPAR